MPNILLNEDETDVVEELMNLSFGYATAAISDLMDSFATLHVPHIVTVDINDAKKIINEKFSHEEKFILTNQLFKGDFEGEIVFVMSDSSIHSLASSLGEDVDDDHFDTLVELTNLVTSASLKQFANYLHTNIMLLEPTIELIQGNQIINQGNIDFYKKTILIDTVLEFESENIKGYMFFLINEEVFQTLKEKINWYIEKYF